MISVVIPYFQRTAGTLRRALTSIARQEDPGATVTVLVVDDESPVKPEPELAGLEWPAGFSVQLLRQPNGGPGAARNCALEHLPATSEVVAFLDSDDEWSSDHLARARRTLASGFDVYFADHLQLDQKVSAFARGKRLSDADHPLADGAPADVRAYVGDMFMQINFGNVIGTSTVAYAWQRFPKLRFRPEFRSAGEDYLFWMGLAQAGARFAYSTRVEALYGRGVNVYSGAQWGTSQHLQRVHDEHRYRAFVGREFSLDPAASARIAEHQRRLDAEFGDSLLSLLFHARVPPVALMRRHYGSNSAMLRGLVAAARRKLRAD